MCLRLGLHCRNKITWNQEVPVVRLLLGVLIVQEIRGMVG